MLSVWTRNHISSSFAFSVWLPQYIWNAVASAAMQLLSVSYCSEFWEMHHSMIAHVKHSLNSTVKGQATFWFYFYRIFGVVKIEPIKRCNESIRLKKIYYLFNGNHKKLLGGDFFSFNFCIVASFACLYDYIKKSSASFPFLNKLGTEVFTNLILYCETF